MCYLTQKVQWSKVLLAGLLYAVVNMVIQQVSAVLTMGYYLDPQYSSVWSKLMMPKAGPPPVNFFILAFILDLIGGIILALFYNFIKGLFKESFWHKVWGFTEISSILLLVLFFFSLYLMINLPLLLLLVWYISSVIIIFISAMIFAKLIK